MFVSIEKIYRILETVFHRLSKHLEFRQKSSPAPNPALWLATRAFKMEVSCPLGTTRCIPKEKFTRKPYNKSFIPQACSVKMAGYWPRSFFCEFMVLDSVSVHKHANKGLGRYRAILNSQLVNYPYIFFAPSGSHDLYNRSEPMSGKSCKASLSSGVPQTKAAFRLRQDLYTQWPFAWQI